MKDVCYKEPKSIDLGNRLNFSVHFFWYEEELLWDQNTEVTQKKLGLRIVSSNVADPLLDYTEVMKQAKFKAF